MSNELSAVWRANLRRLLKFLHRCKKLERRITARIGVDLSSSVGLLPEGSARDAFQPLSVALLRPWREACLFLFRSSPLSSPRYLKSLYGLARTEGAILSRWPWLEFLFGQFIVVSRLMGSAYPGRPDFSTAQVEACLWLAFPSVWGDSLPLERARMRRAGLTRKLPGRVKVELRLAYQDRRSSGGAALSRGRLEMLLAEAETWLSTQRRWPTDLYIEAMEGVERKLLESFGFQVACRFLRSEGEEGAVLMHLTWELLRARMEGLKLEPSHRGSTGQLVKWMNELWVTDIIGHRCHRTVSFVPDQGPGPA